MLRGATSHTTCLCCMAPVTATVVTHCASLMAACHPQPTTTNVPPRAHERRRRQSAEHPVQQRPRTGGHALRRGGYRPCTVGQPFFSGSSARSSSCSTPRSSAVREDRTSRLNAEANCGSIACLFHVLRRSCSGTTEERSGRTGRAQGDGRTAVPMVGSWFFGSLPSTYSPLSTST